MGSVHGDPYGVTSRARAKEMVNGFWLLMAMDTCRVNGMNDLLKLGPQRQPVLQAFPKEKFLLGGHVQGPDIHPRHLGSHWSCGEVSVKRFSSTISTRLIFPTGDVVSAQRGGHDGCHSIHVPPDMQRFRIPDWVMNFVFGNETTHRNMALTHRTAKVG
ncbi:hypothetical protein AAC387_Pa11g1129 [Persea americana]